MEEIDEIEKKTIDTVDRLVFFGKDGRIFISKSIREKFEGYAFLPKIQNDGILLKKVLIR
jgi:hypothetical protein